MEDPGKKRPGETSLPSVYCLIALPLQRPPLISLRDLNSPPADACDVLVGVIEQCFKRPAPSDPHVALQSIPGIRPTERSLHYLVGREALRES